MFSLFAVSALCALSAAMIPSIVRTFRDPEPRGRRRRAQDNERMLGRR